MNNDGIVKSASPVNLINATYFEVFTQNSLNDNNITN